MVKAAMRTLLPAVQAALIAVAVCLVSCTHGPKGQTWDFGQPGPGRIVVFIDGDVKHPGRYYLHAGANLDSVLSVFGGWGGQGDFGGAPPSKVTLQRKQNGKLERVDYRFPRMSTSEREAVRLRDGDQLLYHVSVF